MIGCGELPPAIVEEEEASMIGCGELSPVYTYATLTGAVETACSGSLDSDSSKTDGPKW